MMITQKLNIELPIIQSPMAGVQDSELAIAVCQAGGLGSLPAAMLSIEQLKIELDKLEAINKPYNVNFFVHTPPKFSESDEQHWQQSLASYYQEFDVDPPALNVGLGLAPFSQDIAELLADYKPAVVSFHFGLPAADLVEQVKNWGSIIMSSATTVAEACWLEKNGADLIIAQGLEAGGHRGMFLTDELTTQIGSLSLLPQIIKASELPVIAAGGIGDAQTVRAMIDLGASGVQIGTSYLLCDETKTTAIHRSALQSKSADHTALTNVFTGRPARSIVNRIISEVGPITSVAPQFPLAGGALAQIRSKAEDQGSGDFSPLWSGQNNSGCKQISATELTRQLAAETDGLAVHH